MPISQANKHCTLIYIHEECALALQTEAKAELGRNMLFTVPREPVLLGRGSLRRARFQSFFLEHAFRSGVQKIFYQSSQVVMYLRKGLVCEVPSVWQPLPFYQDLYSRLKLQISRSASASWYGVSECSTHRIKMCGTITFRLESTLQTKQ